MPGHKVEAVSLDGKKTQYQANNIIIATGGAFAQPAGSATGTASGIIGYREALTLEKQPEAMVVVGSGAIGTELAYFYNAMGTKVTLVEFLPSIVPVEDDDVSRELERIFRKKGIKVLTGSEVTAAEKLPDGKVKVTVKTPKGTEEIVADVVLSAVGVQANIEGIGLEETGIKTEKGKILTDPYYRTNVEGYYAIGDVVQGPSLAHVASAEGITAVEKMAGLDVQPMDYGNIPGKPDVHFSPDSIGGNDRKEKPAKRDMMLKWASSRLQLRARQRLRVRPKGL